MSDVKTGAIHLDGSDFDQALKAAGDKPVLVDFYAEWCGPCRMAGPVIDALADEYQGKAVIAKVDVDESHDLSSRFEVKSIPTVIVFRDGKEITRQTGFAGRDGYIAMLEQKSE